MGPFINNVGNFPGFLTPPFSTIHWQFGPIFDPSLLPIADVIYGRPLWMRKPLKNEKPLKFWFTWEQSWTFFSRWVATLVLVSEQVSTHLRMRTSPMWWEDLQTLRILLEPFSRHGCDYYWDFEMTNPMQQTGDLGPDFFENRILFGDIVLISQNPFLLETQWPWIVSDPKLVICPLCTARMSLCLPKAFERQLTRDFFARWVICKKIEKKISQK